MKPDPTEEHPKRGNRKAGNDSRLGRLTLQVTDVERERLKRIAKESAGGESVRAMLENFVADLCDSARRGRICGRYGAVVWLSMHRSALEKDRTGGKGGASC